MSSDHDASPSFSYWPIANTDVNAITLCLVSSERLSLPVSRCTSVLPVGCLSSSTTGRISSYDYEIQIQYNYYVALKVSSWVTGKIWAGKRTPDVSRT